MQRLLGRCATD